MQARLDMAMSVRNRKIWGYYKSGLYSYNKISRIYHISPQRIGQIKTLEDLRLIALYQDEGYTVEKLAELYFTTPEIVTDFLRERGVLA